MASDAFNRIVSPDTEHAVSLSGSTQLRGALLARLATFSCLAGLPSVPVEEKDMEAEKQMYSPPPLPAPGVHRPRPAPCPSAPTEAFAGRSD